MTVSVLTAAGTLPLSTLNIGQVISGTVARASAVSLSTGTAANVTSVALTYGYWLISAGACFVPAASTSITSMILGVSTVSATQPATSTSMLADSTGQILLTSSTAANVVGADIALALPCYTVNITANTTLYLVATSTFTVSTNTVCGSLVAIRFQ